MRATAAGGRSLGIDRLRNVGKYNMNDENHRRVYSLIQSYSAAWQGEHSRTLPRTPDDPLFADKHAFDAWLAALTAWAHSHSETITFKEAALDEEVVDIEGHILILSQEPKK